MREEDCGQGGGKVEGLAYEKTIFSIKSNL